jgi:hypothetical protein
MPSLKRAAFSPIIQGSLTVAVDEAVADDSSGKRGTLEHYPFATHRTPHCVWDGDLAERSRRFLLSLDPGYFQYQAEVYRDRLLAKPDDVRAALSLRTAYLHGLESVVSLIGAILQAPRAIPGWILRCSTKDLIGLVREIDQGKVHYLEVKLPSCTWLDVSRFVHDVKGDDTERQAIVVGFAETWAGFARDFLSDELRAEYNSIKHGFRVRPGGFSMRVRPETTPGVAESETDWHVLGGSPYGTQFLRCESADKNNFRLRDFAVNWSPANMIYGLFMIAASFRNLVARGLVLSGGEPGPGSMWSPPDGSWYSSPWKEGVPLRSSSVDFVFKMDEVTPMSRDEILAVLTRG